MSDKDTSAERPFNSKITIRHLPPELTYEELKEELSEFLPYINHFHFIPGKSPTFYPTVSSDSSSSLNTKVRTSRGVITFSSHSKKPSIDDSLAEKEIESPEEILNQKVALEEHYVNILGGRLSSAYINFTTPESILEFTQKFDGKIFESNRGRSYRAVVRLCFLPPFHFGDLTERISSSRFSLENSNEFKEWVESQNHNSPRPQSSLTFEQQTELILEQERKLYPWKYDPDFFRNTSLMTFIQKKADLEKDKLTEKFASQKSKGKHAESPKEKPKIKKNSKTPTPSKPKDPDPPRPKIKSRTKPDLPQQTNSAPQDSPNKKTFSTNHENALNNPENKKDVSKAQESPKKVKIFTTSKSK
jgi:hypothetical protein